MTECSFCGGVSLKIKSKTCCTFTNKELKLGKTRFAQVKTEVKPATLPKELNLSKTSFNGGTVSHSTYII